jgi:hypothetical protein
MWTDIAIVLFDITLVSLCVSHWLIWDRLAKLNSRLETLEVESIYNTQIIANLRATEEAYEQAIHQGREGKNNAAPRVY